MRKTRPNLLGTLLASLGLMLITSGVLLLLQLPNEYQYVLPAENLEETWHKSCNSMRTIDGEDGAMTIVARRQDVYLQGAGEEVGVTLYAVDETYWETKNELLNSGRFIMPGDIEKQRRVIVIDQETAYALYSGGEAIKHIVCIDGVDWTIIGITSRKTRLGETKTGIAFVPLSTAADVHLNMETVEIHIKENTSVDKSAVVRTTLEKIWGNGSCYDLNREKKAAMMPLHWSVVMIGLLCAIRVFRLLLETVNGITATYRKKLEDHYPRDLLMWVIKKSALVVSLGFVLILIVVFTLIQFASPALVFTDWIPDNLVSFGSYMSRFWTIHQGNAKAISYSTREMSIISLASWLIRWGMFTILGSYLVLIRIGRNTK